ncbi:hypothetical protein [Actinoplanes sp. NPDC049599]|uniref:hypothetical protein n=1 Tax=Actinoplanes sp. NPDC049599 TaxID=3363903 RepID=UPI003792E610
MRVVQWVDRNLWVVPPATFLLVEVVLLIWLKVASKPFLLSSLTPSLRQPVYASLTGTTSALLGFVIAAVTILAAFGPRALKSATAQSVERRVAEARGRLVTSLLVTAIFLLLILVVATLGIATDTRKIGNPLVNLLIVGGAAASLLGFIVSGAGLALAVLERNRGTV